MDKLINCNQDLMLKLIQVASKAVHTHATGGTGIYINIVSVDSEDLTPIQGCAGADLQNNEDILKQIFGVDANGKVYINVFKPA